MEFNKELTFQIYGSIIKGRFLRREGDSIFIITTKDFIVKNIGREQSIHADFLIKGEK